VTHLRQIVLDELRPRNYAESTTHTYIRMVEHFSCYFHRPLDQLDPEPIREYQATLFTGCKLASNSLTQRLVALRFFYVKVLKRGWSVAETPYPKKVLHLPQVCRFRRNAGSRVVGYIDVEGVNRFTQLPSLRIPS